MDDDRSSPELFRLRTSDIWEASAVWAAGWALSYTERDGDRVIFVFVQGGEPLRQVVEDHRRGTLKVSSLAMREGYFAMRDDLSRELRDARHS